MKYSTAFFGKNSLNSLHSCAANVLLWANTSAGLPVCWITFAIVNVLPVPVAPKRVWNSLPLLTPSTNFLIASGWSPFGS